MAALYIDNGVSNEISSTLASLGHGVTRCQDIGLKDAKDHEHLLIASQRGAIVVTHDKGFETLNTIWNRWSVAWGVRAVHPGVLIAPQTAVWPAVRAAQEIDQLLRSSPMLENRCAKRTAHGGWVFLR